MPYYKQLTVAVKVVRKENIDMILLEVIYSAAERVGGLIQFSNVPVTIRTLNMEQKQRGGV